MITLEDLKKQYPKIFRNITQYYPIGVSRSDPRYLNSTENKELSHLINENILSSKKYSTFWTKGVISEIQKETKMEVHDITYGCIPNFGGMIRVVKEEKAKNFGNIVEIQFYVSLIENYISVLIAEIQENLSVCEITEQELIYRKLKNLTVSPNTGKFNPIYLKIEAVLHRCLRSPIFLPYSIDRISVNGLSVVHKNDDNCTIGDAFFRKILPENPPEAVLGNVNYGINNL